MPSFFQFTQGNESRTRLTSDASPLLGRFRAVPQEADVHGRRRRSGSTLGLFSNNRGSVHVGYGALLSAAGLEDHDNVDDRADWEDLSFWQRTWRRIADVWVEPKQGAVKRVVDVWWSRYGCLVLMPAALAIAWCALPIPQYQFTDDDDDRSDPGAGSGHKIPGHGEARVQISFWFFLFVYYGFYNITALIWITKVFNLYSLNWWPQSLGFPVTMSLIAIVSIAVPIPLYLTPETRFLTQHNTAWVAFSFFVMAMPVTIAFCILLTSQRHLKLRQSLSETQRIFTSSWWTGESGGSVPRRDNRRRPNLSSDSFNPDASLQVAHEQSRNRTLAAMGMRRRWLPASFVRFIWFCLALFVGLMAYVIGEAYAEIYLRTLPHNNLETIVYVYSWIITVHLLDALTGWLLGIREGERVGSYPLSWVFKLYFMLTYQTYVRALYARLRSPEQFVYLQILSSSTLIILTPLTMSRLYHRVTVALNLTDQSYASYQKVCTRNVFIRFLAENVSMAAFLGSVLVLHFGPNKDVYPYFAFDRKDKGDDRYDFGLTFWASSVTWACELVASVCVRVLIRYIFGVDVGMEGKLDLAVWPELLPTSVAVMFHVLQNMFFSIIRLQFP